MTSGSCPSRLRLRAVAVPARLTVAFSLREVLGPWSLLEEVNRKEEAVSKPASEAGGTPGGRSGSFGVRFVRWDSGF